MLFLWLFTLLFVGSSFADRSFSIAAPTIWNSLSPSTRSADTIGAFKSRLKTDLFASAYITYGSALSQRFRFACDQGAIEIYTDTDINIVGRDEL